MRAKGCLKVISKARTNLHEKMEKRLKRKKLNRFTKVSGSKVRGGKNPFYFIEVSLDVLYSFHTVR